MTNMAATPKYGKHLLKSSPESINLWGLNLVCSIGYTSIMIIQFMTLDWPCPNLHKGQICSLKHFDMGKSEIVYFLFLVTIAVWELEIVLVFSHNEVNEANWILKVSVILDLGKVIEISK